MLPIIVSHKIPILVIGDGPATQNRLALLEEAGAHYTHHLMPPPTIAHQPSTLAFIADFDEATSAALYQQAKAAGYLVNVEDKKDYCDFHVPARVRRGDLLLTISTGGGSPRLARRLRMMLETLFPPQWSERLQRIERKRHEWKTAGASFNEVADNTDAMMDAEGWLQADCACLRQSQREGE